MDYTNDCSLAKDRAMAAAQEELRLFCRICGIPVGERNYLIGGDPHGVAEINDTYWFNMSDVHVVVSEYERWLKLYETNEGIAKAVREWYYWSLDRHEKQDKIPCPNLRSWLAGCPVPGLREETEEHKRRTEKELTAAHLRLEAAKEEPRKVICVSF